MRLQREERRKKVVEFRYNKWYKDDKRGRSAGVFKEGVGRNQVAKGDEIWARKWDEGGKRYWEKDERKRCRLCERRGIMGNMYGKNVSG